MSLFSRLLQSSAWPGQCLICRGWPSATLCSRCVARFAVPQPRCETCALPVPPGVARCGACVRTPAPFDRCLAATAYRWPWTRCIGQFKFRQDPGLAAPLAELMAAAPGVAPALATADAVVPLPLSSARLAERGYNPAQLLASRLAGRRARTDWLLRVRHTPPQRGLTRAERLKNVRGAFAVAPTHVAELRGRHLLLVDDVMTTGASLGEAARVLRAAGAAQVSALALARTDEA